MRWLEYTHISPYLAAEREGPEAMTPQSQQRFPEPRFGFLILLSNKKNQGSLEKWLIQDGGQAIYKLSLEYL